MKLLNPNLYLKFLGGDLEPGHSAEQIVSACHLIQNSFSFKRQLLNGLKSSSDQISLQITRDCPSVEDILATDGDVTATLSDTNGVIYTGYLGTNVTWGVTDHGEQALNVTLESKGTRLFNKPYIETGKHFFDDTASAVIYSLVNPLGITIRQGDERKLLQNVRLTVEAGTPIRELIDQLCYECNAVYWFNNLGELCIYRIGPSTEDAPVLNHLNLRFKAKNAVSMTKQLRTYNGARVAYKELAQANNFLIYRNTTGQGSGVPYCNLVLSPGYYWDGAEMYTAAEWSAATADEFREPTLIGAVNAASESSVVGSGEIISIRNLRQTVNKSDNIDFSAQIVGGPYFKMLAHNRSGVVSAAFTRLDLYADVIYVKSHGVIRTQIDGASEGKTVLEEELRWIHDKTNASLHANLLAQYHKHAAAAYTFHSREQIAPGTVVRLNDDVFSGLDVFVLVTGCQSTDRDETITYNAVGVSDFDLSDDVWHGTTEQAQQSGARGPKGDPGETTEIQYAVGNSAVNPPTDVMLWNGEPMLWNGEPMLWSNENWSETVPELERGKYIWIRSRVGDTEWQYTRLTGSTLWAASIFISPLRGTRKLNTLSPV